QLEEALVVVSDERSFELLALDEALENLAEMDPQKARMVELRYFGGLSVEETAEVMGVSEITVKRHWKLAKAWLYGQIART
ncbi:MAG TPA: ECF-type sigma factor, partial [Pyrinomonadaceae bacterium]|nr:ECF-type sigma factor [Pyrinomonadaceae bacterium]